MEEIWKDIKGYEGLYQVSNLGKIKSLGRIIERIGPKGSRFYRTYPEKLLKYCKDTRGYYRANLALNGVNTTIKVHRVVAQAFIPNPEGKPQINHKDGNKQNNSIYNLEWCDNQENQDHSWRIGLRKKGKEHWSYGQQPEQLKKVTGKGIANPNYGNRGIKNPLSRKVIQYDLNGNIIKEWNCIKDVEREIKIKSCNISNCCRGNRRTTGGYIWKYKL